MAKRAQTGFPPWYLVCTLLPLWYLLSTLLWRAETVPDIIKLTATRRAALFCVKTHTRPCTGIPALRTKSAGDYPRDPGPLLNVGSPASNPRSATLSRGPGTALRDQKPVPLLVGKRLFPARDHGGRSDFCSSAVNFIMSGAVGSDGREYVPLGIWLCFVFPVFSASFFGRAFFLRFQRAEGQCAARRACAGAKCSAAEEQARRSRRAERAGTGAAGGEEERERNTTALRPIPPACPCKLHAPPALLHAARRTSQGHGNPLGGCTGQSLTRPRPPQAHPRAQTQAQAPHPWRSGPAVFASARPSVGNSSITHRGAASSGSGPVRRLLLPPVPQWGIALLPLEARRPRGAARFGGVCFRPHLCGE
jgi:hypothetical protein